MTKRPRRSNRMAAVSSPSNMDVPPQAPRSKSSIKRTAMRIVGVVLFAVILPAIAMVGPPWFWSWRFNQSISDGRFPAAKADLSRVDRWWISGWDRTVARGNVRLARMQGDADLADRLAADAGVDGLGRNRFDNEQVLIQIHRGDATLWLPRFNALMQSAPDQEIDLLDAYTNGLIVQRQWQAAEQMAARWVRRAPASGAALARMGQVQRGLNRPAKTAEYFRKAQVVAPERLMVIEGLADAMFATDKLDESLALYKKVVDRTAIKQITDAKLEDGRNAAPVHHIASMKVCELLMLLGRQSEAVACLRSTLDQHPRSFAARHALAEHLSKTGQAGDVIETLDPILKEFSADSSVNYLLAGAHAQLGDTERSNQYLQRHLAARKELDRLMLLGQRIDRGDGDDQAVLEIAEGYLKYQWELAEPWITIAGTILPDSPRTKTLQKALHRKLGLPASNSE